MSLEAHDIPLKGMEATITEWVKEALELRHGDAGDALGRLELPAFEAGRDAVLNTLRRTRVRLDRTEELQAKARQAKGRVTRLRANAEFEASIEYDRATQNRANRRMTDFVTAAERNADASLDTLEQKIVLNQAKRLESVADEAYDIIKGCYWGLDKIRTELLEMLRVHDNLIAVEVQT